MKKRAIRASVTSILITASLCAGAEAPPQAILQCTGEQTSEGINTPKYVTIPKRAPNVGDTYTLQGDVLIESGGGTFADEHYNLCRSTSTTYVYSTDCSVDRLHYISEWLDVTNVPASDKFIARHKDSPYTLDTIIIDRVNLSVNAESLNNQSGTKYDKKANNVVLIPYLLSTRFLGNCSVEKPKL